MKPDAEGFISINHLRWCHWLGDDTYQTFLNSLFDLLDFDFAETFDFEEILAGGAVDRLDIQFVSKE